MASAAGGRVVADWAARKKAASIFAGRTSSIRRNFVTRLGQGHSLAYEIELGGGDPLTRRSHRGLTDGEPSHPQRQRRLSWRMETQHLPQTP